ncbi:hypothetical protein Ga0451573_000632 [Peptococcaceae bacterium DYL19]|nr:hypothetical protein [Phosphitispora fastidiosa]
MMPGNSRIPGRDFWKCANSCRSFLKDKRGLWDCPKGCLLSALGRSQFYLKNGLREFNIDDGVKLVQYTEKNGGNVNGG